MAKAEVRARAKKLISLGQLRPLSYARPLLNVPKQEPRKHSEKLFGVGGLRSLKYPRPILTMGDALPLFDRLYPLKEPLRRVLEITGTPGCAIHVCHRGEEWTANFGVLSIVSERPVTSDSIFYLTSLTTGITAAAFATLVHEGKVDWTTPVRSVIPEVNDARLTPLDLLSMRSGYYPADALTWQGENIALLLKADTVKHWNALPQLGEFRNSYKYNSWGYALVGILIERLTGQTLSQVFKDRIFDPLELKNTQMFQWGYNHHNFEATRSYGLHPNCRMHVRIADEYLTGEDLFLEGASGVTSNTKDMITLYSAYLEAFNDQTATGSDVTPDNPFVHCQTIFKGHTFMSQDTSYACGWVRTRLPAPLGAIGINATQTTMPRVHHTGPSRLCFYNQGMMPGAVSNVTLLPETDTVIAIVANASHAGDVADWASQMIIEELLEAPIRHDWERKANGVLSKITNHLPTVKRELDENQRRGTRPPYPLPRYKGSYWNDTFNLKIDINVQGDHLLMSFNGVTIPSAEKDKSMCDVAKKITYSLRHYEDNTFEWFLPHNKSVSKGRFVHLGTTESFLIRFKGTNRLLWQTGDFGSQPSVFIKKRRRTLALAP